jgi:serine/threonine-protein kinase
VTDRLGPYEVGAKIGGGGMATVYVGRRVDGEPLGEVVAIKVVRDELASDKQYVTMFLDEAKILSRLSHPDIIVTREYGVTDDSRYIAMELLLGRSMMDMFDRVAEREERMPIDLAAYVAMRVAGALAYAHDLKNESGAPLNVIHRDVNPTNIFLTYDGHVKLIDFGLAKSSSRLARSGEGIVKGKVPYLSPEQIEEKPFDKRADIYSLGASLWEMTTGRRLFKRATDVQTIRAIREQDIPDPRTFVDGIYPEALWNIVRRALERDPAKRYASGVEMATDLDAFLQKHGRKGEMASVLAAWIEDLFPGERAKQEAWLAEVSEVPRAEAKKTMAPPAPIPAIEKKQGDDRPAPTSDVKERHPVAAFVALAGAVGFLVVLAVVFGRC